MEGGKATYIEQPHIGAISDYSFTRRSKNNRKTRNTKKTKQKKQNKLSEMDHFRARMNLPIGSSSVSFPLTPKMIADNERISKMIDERIRNGSYYP